MQSTKPALPFRYSFRWHRATLASGFLLMVSSAWIALWLTFSVGKVGLGLLMILFSLIIIVAFFLTVLGTSPLQVDDHAITRRVLGRDCPRLEWREVAGIDVYFLPSSAGLSGPRKAYVIRPKSELAHPGYLGKIAFNDQPSARLDDLLYLLDHFSDHFDIPVNLGAGVTKSVGGRL